MHQRKKDQWFEERGGKRSVISRADERERNYRKSKGKMVEIESFVRFSAKKEVKKEQKKKVYMRGKERVAKSLDLNRILPF